MKAAHLLRSLAFVVAAPLLAQKAPADPRPELVISYAPYVVQFDVFGPQPPFVGLVLVSLQPELAHYLVGLPPLLGESIVLDWGVAPSLRFHSVLPETMFAPGVMFYVQGVTLGEAGIFGSDVHSFVLDATGTSGH